MSEIYNIYETSFKTLCKKIDATLNVDEYNGKLVEIQDNYNKRNQNINIEMRNKNILIDDEINTQNQGLIEDDYAQQQKLNYIGREVFDIEKIGNNITDKLYEQGEQMKSIRDNVINMNKEADDSNSLMVKIMKQARRNKILMYGCGVLAILIFIMVMIYKFK